MKFVNCFLRSIVIISISSYAPSALSKIALATVLKAIAEAPDTASGLIDQFIAQKGNINQNNGFLLILAARLGTPDMIEKILKAGADVNAQEQASNFKLRPLHAALLNKSKNLDLVKLLLDYGADPLLSKGDGQSALTFAKKEFLGAVKLLQQYLPLQDAIEKQFVEKVKALLQIGADVNQKNSSGETPLHAAIGYSTEPKKLAILKQLLAVPDIMVDPQDKLGITPLHDAIKVQNLEAVQALLDKNASVNLADNDGDTAFTLAQKKVTEAPTSPVAQEILKIVMQKNPELADNKQETLAQFSLLLTFLSNAGEK